MQTMLIITDENLMAIHPLKLQLLKQQKNHHQQQKNNRTHLTIL